MTQDTTSPTSASGAPKKITVETLDFREITRGTLPEELGAALVNKEGVHPLKNLDELKETRVAPASNPDGGGFWDKHCFGLFIPGQTIPEAVVYVKLVHLTEKNRTIENSDLPGNIQDILKEEVKPIKNPNAAIFFTITNTARRGEPGYQAPEIQNRTAPERLINEVANKLIEQRISDFSTLSPLRSGTGNEAQGFHQWLEKGLKEREAELVTEEEQQQIQQLAKTFCNPENDASTLQCLNLLRQKYREIGTREGGKEAQRFIQQIMKDMGTNYLMSNENPNMKDGTHTHYDPVANFHLRNGAMIARFHWAPADETTVSETIGGAGLMVNYRYEPEELSARREAFRNRGEIAVDPKIKARHEARMEALKVPMQQIDAATAQQAIGRGAPPPLRGV
jgi:hypothetical protein